ncbi:hypothetical protein IU443_03625 [Nocardia farcinica]|uniref:Uncharacterized protein n=1 Tax=Nocardia farcinica TaxID=37329 RepID=A0A0H5NKT0_NOCFR|nr:hypothetical protein [Nocardia farcinica]MBF6255923.1 hypothetical protein [Nocardia farcinica]MBF6260977.1 hypothetical protein [Nocardia farcinica]MBF6279355.1 hypothetical protein [Nocardia farcinica]MBF6303987.1 hypothetical protein [Nocardia farcinica]MBF6359197.1 hypothetical protein [Nocardia farcinica]
MSAVPRFPELGCSTPADLAPVPAAWERRRDPARFAGLLADPGSTTA